MSAGLADSLDGKREIIHESKVTGGAPKGTRHGRSRTVPSLRPSPWRSFFRSLIVYLLLLGPCPRPLLGRALAPPAQVQELGLPTLFQFRLEAGDHLEKEYKSHERPREVHVRTTVKALHVAPTSGSIRGRPHQPPTGIPIIFKKSLTFRANFSMGSM
jgi:hypothetical protein